MVLAAYRRSGLAESLRAPCRPGGRRLPRAPGPVATAAVEGWSAGACPPCPAGLRARFRPAVPGSGPARQGRRRR
ncbi:hypothetical protein ACFFX0_06860 [Citricoccus parietis]|uniref:Uncharacterized protein n=1 Tax=Citricoccus parietis TaxID=592307 RepID=A0ABV5FW80_9MICC